MIEFVVPTVPVPQPRQRHRIVNARGRQFTQNYTPTKHPVNACKAAIQQAFFSVYKGPPLNGPISMLLVFVFPRPKAKIWKTKPMPREWYTASRNDWDNLGKTVSDALNGIAWHDDGQIVSVSLSRVIAAGDEQPHIFVRISPDTPL